MSFSFSESNELILSKCSKKCILGSIEGNKPKEICFAGFSKGHNKGLRYDDQFYLERLAINWDGNCHDFHTSINRDEVVKEGIVLDKIRGVKHPNLLKIINICECSIVVEYIEGMLLNTKKEKWYIGPHSNTLDYVDICNKFQLINLFRKIGEVLLLLHQNGICHTDVAAHNVMVCKKTHEPILIDLIGAMPYTEELRILDEYVYLNHLVVPMSARKNIHIPRDRFEKMIPHHNSIKKLIHYFEKALEQDIDLRT